MNKREYLDMLIKENEDEPLKALYGDVIDCLWLALSDVPDTFEIKDTSITPKQLYEILDTKAREESLKCIGPFEAAEIFANVFGTKFVRPSMKSTQTKTTRVNLEDFF